MILPSGVVVRIVRNHDGIITGSSSECSTVTNMKLNVADNSSLGNRSKGKHVTYNESRLLTTVEELSRVHTFGGDKELLLLLVTDRMSEIDAS